MPKQKIPWCVGDVVKVDLGDGTMGFGRVLSDPLMAFYDLRTNNVPTLDAIVSSTVLFRVWVMHYAIKSGFWKVIGNLPLSKEPEDTPKFFKRDPINGKYSIYYREQDIPATQEETEGLECAAVWEPEHVEDRLRDHFAGKPNVWVELLRYGSIGSNDK
jgi:hypothetical protein